MNKKIRSFNEGTIESDQQGKHKYRPTRIQSPVRRSVRNHIDSFPTKDSHYCRQTTNKHYLDENVSLKVTYEKYR